MRELTPRVEIDGFARRVLIRGADGPAVVLMHELPGMTPACLKLADRLAARGFTVYLPLLFGEPGDNRMLRGLGRLCMEREFRRLALGCAGDEPGPTTRWLRELGRRLRRNHDGPGIGVIGMCLSGGFVLAMMVDAHVLAGVTCQPSMPLALTRRMKRSIGVSDGDLAAVKTNTLRCSALLGLRFSADRLAPPERFDALKQALGERFERIDIPSGLGDIPSTAHGTLTDDYEDRDGHPTRSAFERVVAFLNTGLRPTGS